MKSLLTACGRKIAFSQSNGDGTGIVFLGGFMSDMAGTKALHLDAWCKKQKRPFLRFDYSGHGASSGSFTDGCIGDWAEDAQAAITNLTEGPQVLVGSSMGGWISLLIAKRVPERVAGLVTIAAAPDFTEDGFWRNFNEDTRKQLNDDGVVKIPSEYGEPYPITKRLIEDGRLHLVLRKPLKLSTPARLLQGDQDDDVSVETVSYTHLTLPTT